MIMTKLCVPMMWRCNCGNNGKLVVGTYTCPNCKGKKKETEVKHIKEKKNDNTRNNSTIERPT